MNFRGVYLLNATSHIFSIHSRTSARRGHATRSAVFGEVRQKKMLHWVGLRILLLAYFRYVDVDAVHSPNTCNCICRDSFNEETKIWANWNLWRRSRETVPHYADFEVVGNYVML